MASVATANSAELLRFITAGSVDDGKSTLIGRLLYDSKTLLADQLTAVEAASRRRGRENIDLSLLTDGLIAEREQGITIDVAYRYFATPARKFIIGDSPGHIQYTRNMVTAASNADLAVLLVDARHGLQAQTRRHAYLANWAAIPRVVLAVNKMDLVDGSQDIFNRIRDEFQQFSTQLEFDEVLAIPISALHGDMVVERGTIVSWYRGPTLLEYLETVPVADHESAKPFRFPVQRVLRIAGGNVQPGSGYEKSDCRGYQGTIASGQVMVGQEVVALPGGARARIAEILTADGPLAQAFAGMAVTVRLDPETDVSRGDLIASASEAPSVRSEFDAELCWFDAEPFDRDRQYLIKQGTTTARVKLASVRHHVDITVARPVEPREMLAMNDIAGVALRTQRPLVFDPYRENRGTGAFIIIDESSNHTVAAGTIV